MLGDFKMPIPSLASDRTLKAGLCVLFGFFLQVSVLIHSDKMSCILKQWCAFNSLYYQPPLNMPPKSALVELLFHLLQSLQPSLLDKVAHTTGVKLDLWVIREILLHCELEAQPVRHLQYTVP